MNDALNSSPEPPELDIAPVPAPEGLQFWKQLGQGTLATQQCKACAHRQYPPLPFCERCRGTDLGWTPTAGEGTVLTSTTVHHAPHPAFANHVPYTVGIVQLDEGVRMSARLEVPADLDPVGMRVHAHFPTNGVVHFRASCSA